MKSVFKFLFCIFAMFLILSNYSFSEAAQKQEKWVVTLGGTIPACPAIGSDGTIYVGDSDTNSLRAINPDSSPKWSFPTGGYVQSSPAIGSDGTIYVGSNDDYLYAINPDRSLKWKFLTGGDIVSSPAIGSDGTVYVGSNDKKLYAINPADHSKKWSVDLGGEVHSSPAIGSDGTIYVGSENNNDNFFAINPADGSTNWSVDLGTAVHSSPAIGSDGTIYVGSSDSTNNLYAINPADHSIKWYCDTDKVIASPPAIGSDGTIYVTTDGGKLFAVEGNSGGLADTPWPKFHHNAKNTGNIFESDAVQASSIQASGVTVGVTNCCAKEMTNAELNTKYSTNGFNIKSMIRSFNATISVNGGCGTFKFNSTAVPTSRVADLRLIKFYDTNGTSKGFRTYASSGPEYAIDGSWWLTNSIGTHLAASDVTTLGTEYYVYFVVQDNGDYDENRALGAITDPVGFGSTTGDSGCVLNPNAGLGIEWLFMGLVAVVLMFRMRFMKRY